MFSHSHTRTHSDNNTRYDVNVLSDYLKSLAVVLHQEIVNTDEDDVVRATLDTMHAIAKVVSESSSQVLWNHFVDPIISGCVKELSSSKTRTMLGDRALKVLQHLSRAGRKVYDVVITKSISNLLENKDVDTIVELIKCDAVAEITLVSKKMSKEHPLKTHADPLLDLFLSSRNFEGLRHLLIQPPQLVVSKQNLIRAVKDLSAIDGDAAMVTLVEICSRHYEFAGEEIGAFVFEREAREHPLVFSFTYSNSWNTRARMHTRVSILLFSHSHTRTRGIPALECTLEYHSSFLIHILETHGIPALEHRYNGCKHVSRKEGFSLTRVLVFYSRRCV